MSAKKNLRLALGHKARVGKDELADLTVREHGAVVIRNAEKLYEVCSAIQTVMGKPVQKDSTLLQVVGEGLRNVYGDDVWISKSIERINAEISRNPEVNIVVPDMRRKNEFRQLKAAGFTTVDIVRPGRPIDRDPHHISETDLDDVEFDVVIRNEGDLDEYRSKIRSALSL